jgi:hypothetical protein
MFMNGPFPKHPPIGSVQVSVTVAPVIACPEVFWTGMVNEDCAHTAIGQRTKKRIKMRRMNITESKVYNFTFNSDGIGYNFNIPAPSQQEAIDKLYRALVAIAGELKVELARITAN